MPSRHRDNTVVFKIESRAYLKKFTKKAGWHINWAQIPKDVEVYALALHDTNEIQGLVGVKNDIKTQKQLIFIGHALRHITTSMTLGSKSTLE